MAETLNRIFVERKLILANLNPLFKSSVHFNTKYQLILNGKVKLY